MYENYDPNYSAPPQQQQGAAGQPVPGPGGMQPPAPQPGLQFQYSPEKKNIIATILKAVGFVILGLGFLIGVVSGILAEEDGFLQMFSIWIFTFVGGITYLGISEIITLLQRLVDKQAFGQWRQ